MQAFIFGRGVIPLAIGVGILAGCAVDDSRPLQRDPGATEMARVPDCAENEIAICISTNCTPEDYSCVDREDARQILAEP